MTGPASLTVAPPPGAHGGDGAQLARALGRDPREILDLSASLNPVAPDPTALVAGHVEAVGRYPDPAPAAAALACAMDVEPTHLLLTNGGAEAIALVAAELQVGWIDEPDFSLYRRHLPVVDPAGGRWRSNPHNPTGLLAGPDHTAAVWDEAFWPLATGTWTRGDTRHGSVVVGSLTKLLACPGLRIGYVLCPTHDLADRLSARQPRWALNGLAAAALPELLAAVDLKAWASQTAHLRDRLAAVLRGGGYEPRPSHANWLLVEGPGLRDQLAARSILVRDCASFGMPGTVRIAVPDAAGLARLEDALAGLAGPNSPRAVP